VGMPASPAFVLPTSDRARVLVRGLVVCVARMPVAHMKEDPERSVAGGTLPKVRPGTLECFDRLGLDERRVWAGRIGDRIRPISVEEPLVTDALDRGPVRPWTSRDARSSRGRFAQSRASLSDENRHAAERRAIAVDSGGATRALQTIEIMGVLNRLPMGLDASVHDQERTTSFLMRWHHVPSSSRASTARLAK
jgi:hypothetical protein